MPDDKPAVPPVQAESAAPFQDFIISSELAEVYLLLDNVSMSANKRLPQATADDASDGDLIEQICQIRWPPAGQPADRAKQAAQLLHARDRLNAAAAPATGATIAFTLLVAGEGGIGKRNDPSPATSLLLGGAAQTRPPPSRISLATMAFPNLQGEARQFRRTIPVLVVGLFALFVLTSLLSWDIAVGNSVLAEWTKVKASVSQDVGGAPAGAPAPPVSFLAPGQQTAAQVLHQQQNARDLAFASVNLNHWLGPWELVLAAPSKAPGVCPSPCPPNLSADVNEKWAGALLNVLGGAVLPVFYGMLGAGARVVRTISANIRESLLSPRHLPLAFVQLTLGAVIGGCIGLFVTPSGAPSSAPPGLLGSVPLSASALCFIAGFGVDGVFQALESLISRVFNIADPTKPKPAS
jgi:hypothetical protein